MLSTLPYCPLVSWFAQNMDATQEALCECTHPPPWGRRPGPCPASTSARDDPQNFPISLSLSVLSCKMAEEGRYRGHRWIVRPWLLTSNESMILPLASFVAPVCDFRHLLLITSLKLKLTHQRDHRSTCTCTHTGTHTHTPVTKLYIPGNLHSW